MIRFLKVKVYFPRDLLWYSCIAIGFSAQNANQFQFPISIRILIDSMNSGLQMKACQVYIWQNKSFILVLRGLSQKSILQLQVVKCVNLTVIYLIKIVFAPFMQVNDEETTRDFKAT